MTEYDRLKAAAERLRDEIAKPDSLSDRSNEMEARWDYSAAADPSTILSLLSDLEEAKRENENLRELGESMAVNGKFDPHSSGYRFDVNPFGCYVTEDMRDLLIALGAPLPEGDK